MIKVNNEDVNSNSGEISFKDIILKMQGWWAFILSKWVVIIIGALVGAALGLAYSFIKKPLYKAELSFALQDEKSGGGLSGALGLASQFGIDLGGGSAGGEFSGDNLLQLMRSRTVVEKTLLTPVTIKGKTQTLAEVYIDFNGLRQKWADDPQLKTIYFLPGGDRSKFSVTQDSILGIFNKELIKNNLVVDKIDKKLSIIALQVNSKNELFSKYFAETWAKVVSDFYVQTKTKKGSQNVALMQRQTDSVRQILNSAISGVASSADSNPNANPLLQSLHVSSQKKQIDVQTNVAILNELVKNLEASKMSLLQETPLIQAIDKPILPLEVQKVDKIKATVIGGMATIFLMVVVLSLRRFFKNVLT
jgi:hypothetical protein